MKKFWPILIIAAFLLQLITGCSRYKKGIEAVVLLDYSGSLSDAEFNRYVDMLRRGVFQHMTFNDHIVLIPIDKASEMKNEIIGECDFSQLKEPLSKNIPQFAVLSEEDTIQSRFQAAKDTIFQSRIYNLRKERSQFNVLTDIIGSINQAVVYLTRAKTPRKVLFIFSDMIQESREVNLKYVHTAKAVEDTLRILEERGEIPDLQGTYVFICGATGKTNEQYRLNQRFWRLFFEKANAIVYDYGYGDYDRIGPFLNDLRKGLLSRSTGTKGK